MIRFGFLALALFCGASALASESSQPRKPSGLTGVELSLLDGDAIAYGTFQSHNQKVVSTRNGMFITHVHKSNTNYMAQQWRLSRSDDGATFTTVLEDTHATSAPAVEADRQGHLFLCRPDFLDGNAYLYRIDTARPDAQPQVSRLAGGAAGKYCLLLDEPREQLYWFAHNNTFHIATLDGIVRTNLTLLAAGKRAVLQYPHLALDTDGRLFAAWTTSRPTGYLYHSVHAIQSPDGGQSWQSLDGLLLKLPIIADDGGPSTQISKDSEFDVHTWLAAFMAKDRKLHFVYWAETSPQRQWYRRYDTATGRSEIETENIFANHKQEKPNDSGAFAARRTVADSTLYFVSTVDDRKRLACLASDDNGRSWYEYADSDRLFPFRVYSIGAARELTEDGMIVGTFTDVVEKAKTYYEDNSGHVYCFRIQAGLCRANLRAFSYRTGRLKLEFDEIRGQPGQIRLGFGDGSWSGWHPFGLRLDLPAKDKPQQYQLRSRLRNYRRRKHSEQKPPCMKNRNRLPIAASGGLVFALGLALNASAAETVKSFRAGANLVDISPTNLPVIVNAMFTERSAGNIADPLHARALVLDDGATRIAIAVVDTCLMGRDLLDRAKDLASKATGIPPARMLISATHTHSAPSAMACLGSRQDTNYAAFLVPRIAEAIVGANKRLAPARIGWAAVDDWEHTFNRSWIRRSDKILNDPFGNPTVRANMHPGYESPDVTGPTGTVDPGLTILSIRSTDGQPIALLANYSQHYYGSPLLSADYYGRFAQHIATLIGATNSNFVPILSQGTSGDLMWMDYASPIVEIGYDAYAKEVATRAFDAYQRIQYHPWVPLKMAERKLQMNYRAPDEQRLAWAQQVAATLQGPVPKTQPEIYAREAIYLHERPRTELKLQALRIGDLGIAAIPNEVYALTGLKIKAQSPLATTFNMELANGAEGYIPTPEQHVLGGYTTWPARTAGLEIQAEPRITETVLGLLEEVAGKPRRNVADIPGIYTKAVLTARPLAYWRMNEMRMPTARDASGNGHDGAYEEGVAFYLPGPGSGSGFLPKPELKPSSFSGADQINRAVHFAGGRLKTKLEKLGGSYSVEFWVWNGFPTSVRAVTGYLFSRGRNGDAEAAGDHLGIGGTSRSADAGKLFFFNGNRLNGVLPGKTELALRAWNHVVMVRQGKRVEVYLNGNATPEISGEAESSLPEGGEVFIGGRCDNFANFEGKLDEVAVYDREISAVEAGQHYQAAGLRAQSAAASETGSPKPPPFDSPPLSPEDSFKRIHVRPGYEAELVAAEPLLESPVAIDWDERGRLWVVEMVDYPLGLDGKGKPGGRVRILEDTNGDGKYDKTTLVADGLRFPTGILTWRDGAIVTAAPEILLLKPAEGGGKVWTQQVLYSGFFEANQQLRVNGLRWGLDNWVYCANGAHHGAYGTATRIKSTITGDLIPLGSRDFRFKADTGELDPQSGPAQFGRNPDNWGNWFGVQNSWPLWHYVLQDHHIRRNPHVPAPDPVQQVIGPKNPQVFPSGKLEKRFHSFNESGHFTSACAAMIYRDELLFGASSTMHSFTCEPFHNLVHHGVIEDDGVSFKGRRAGEEQVSEFFSSADRWTRPVMTRTGPDGALWVVDMYRYMIEHPEWLPPEGRAELMPHYRAGEDRGRIYRVFPAGHRPAPPRRLDKFSVPQLVAALNSPNGWQRDKIQQMLIWKSDPAAVPLLEKLATSSHGSPLARLHALCTLDGLNALKPELVEGALADPAPGVRINALRLAEPRLTQPILTAAEKLINDADPKVRLQLACTLGQWNDSRAGQALGRLAVANHSDKFIVAAVMSSAVPHCRALVDAAVSAGGSALGSLSEPLLNLSLALDERDSVARLLQPSLTASGSGFSPQQMEVFSQFLDTLAHRKVTWTDLLSGHSGDALASQLQSVKALLAAAQALATDPAKPDADRVTAAVLLAHESSTKKTAIQILSDWLTPQTAGEIQRSAVKAIGLTGDEAIPRLLAKNWGALGPETRVVILDELMSREPWTFALVQQLQEGLISPAILDPVRKDRLLRHHSARVKEIAAKVLNANGTASRAKVIEDFRSALVLTGDASRGKAVHAKLCAVCHKLGDAGNDVGPNLQSVVAHPPEKLLVSILDPNASIEPGYLAYSCTLLDGEELYGIIAAETGNSLVLKLADGKTRTILRGNIASLRSGNLSLMPEGLESGMSKQELADLIVFLRTPSGR